MSKKPEPTKIERPLSQSNRDNTTNKADTGLLFFDRKDRKSIELGRSGSKVFAGVFTSSRAPRTEGSDIQANVVGESDQMFSMKEQPMMVKKPSNMNFLSRHFSTQAHQRTTSKGENGQMEQKLEEPRVGEEIKNGTESARVEKMSQVSPRIGFSPSNRKPSTPDIKFNISGKIDLHSAAEMIGRKASLARSKGDTEPDEAANRKKKFASFFEQNQRSRDARVKVMMETMKTDSQQQKRGGWRIFSFDRRDKTSATTESSSNIHEVKESSKGEKPKAASIAMKEDLKFLNSSRKSGLLGPQRPNYYMKSLEYYYQMEKNDYYSRLYKEHFQLSFNSMKFIKMINKTDADKFAVEGRLNLKKKIFYNNKKTLIFDLDETLVHCAEGMDLGDTNITVSFPNGKEIEASIFIRPHAKETLQRLSKDFEIIIFTASHSGYAEKVVDILDPEKQWVSHRLFREHCFASKQGVYVKDLRVINRKMKDMLIVDNALYSYGLQLNNGIPIVPFYNCKEDAELLMLTEYVLTLKDEDDVRIPNREMFKYECLETSDTLANCFTNIFFPGKSKNRGASQQKRPSSEQKNQMVA